MILLIDFQMISFCLPPGSYRLTIAIFSVGEDAQRIYEVSLGSQCEYHTVTDVNQSEKCYI